jgi:hypothetical protein
MRAAVIGHEIRWDDDLYLRWRYHLGRADVGRGELWVLQCGGEPLAITGVEDLRLLVQHRELLVHRLMDLLIKPELQDAGLGLWMNQFLCQQHGNVLAVGANERSAGLVARAFDPLPERRSFVRPIRMAHFLGKSMGHPRLGGLIGSVANPLLGLHLRLLTWPGRQGIRVSKVNRWPADVQSLLVRAQRADRIEVLRSPEYWEWRTASPRGRFDFWEARDRGGQILLGFMITRRDEPEPGRLVWTVMDLVLDGARQQPTLRALMRHTLMQAERAKVEYMLWVGYRQDIEPELQRAGFVRRPGIGLAMSWRCTDPALKQAGARKPDWSFNELHNDSD